MDAVGSGLQFKKDSKIFSTTWTVETSAPPYKHALCLQLESISNVSGAFRAGRNQNEGRNHDLCSCSTKPEIQLTKAAANDAISCFLLDVGAFLWR